MTNDKTGWDMKTVRDTVESVWIAIVLAFVLRAFIVEAFVIPTGSMAPRLMGEHWELVCPDCGWRYAYGWPGQPDAAVNRGAPQTAGNATCPDCGYQFTAKDYVDGGDRVLVMKLPYAVKEPRPWDVVVFRNPQSNHDNYIKRLIGVPGETLLVVHGDVFYKSAQTGDQWRIRRKTPSAQEEMWQTLYDNDYPPDLAKLAEQQRLSPQQTQKAREQTPHWVAAQGDDPAWNLSLEQGRVFDFKGDALSHEVRLEAPRSWFLPRYGYNRWVEPSPRDSVQADVSGDLKVSAVMTPQAANAELTLAIQSSGQVFEGHIRASGEVRLTHQPADRQAAGAEDWGSAKLPPMEIGRGVTVALEHADFRVKLLVDGKEVLASTDRQYSPDFDKLIDEVGRVYSQIASMQNSVRAGTYKSEEDAIEQIAPKPGVSLWAVGGAMRLSHIRVARDVFYTSNDDRYAPPLRVPNGADNAVYAYAQSDAVVQSLRERYGRDIRSVADIAGWGIVGHYGGKIDLWPIALAKHDDNPDLDEFFMMGDNSPQSLDGRWWVQAAPTLRLWNADNKPQYTLGTVPRYNLIGKAFFVYWPSGFRAPGLPNLPIIPNVGKMRFIR